MIMRENLMTQGDQDLAVLCIMKRDCFSSSDTLYCINIWIGKPLYYVKVATAFIWQKKDNNNSFIDISITV